MSPPMSTVPASAAVAPLVSGIGDSFHLTGAQPASNRRQREYWLPEVAMGPASRFDPGTPQCHGVDHCAYAAGLIANVNCRVRTNLLTG
jgi:hypothetical protein